MGLFRSPHQVPHSPLVWHLHHAPAGDLLSSRSQPSNNGLERTRHCMDRASPLNPVFYPYERTWRRGLTVTVRGARLVS
jgi:hypothetical protein